MDKRRLILLTALLACLPFTAWAGGDDFGWIPGFEVTKQFNKRLDLSFDGELRTRNGFKNVDRFDLGLSVSYDLFDFLKINGGYSYLRTYKPREITLKDLVTVQDAEGNATQYQEYNDEAKYATDRHRFYASLTGEYKVSRFVFSLRERVQYTYQEEATTDKTKYRYSSSLGSVTAKSTQSDTISAKNKTMLRSRLMVKWDIRKCKFEPYASYELSNWINNGGILDKTRVTVGTKYKITKQSSLDLYYLYQQQNDNDEADGHFIGLSYNLKF